MFGSLLRHLELYAELICLKMLLYSLQNWIEDLYWKQHEINYPGMDDAMVCAVKGLSFLCALYCCQF